MKCTRWLGVAAGILQLSLVVGSVAHISLARYGWLGAYIGAYGMFSAANSGYGYFAPNVGTEFRATFAVTDAAGRRFDDCLEETQSAEANIRVANMFTLFRETLKNDAFKRGLVASWASKMFERHPAASKVAVTVAMYRLPSLAEYHAGQRPSWQNVYEAEFTR